jgi:hypothetical protein
VKVSICPAVVLQIGSSAEIMLEDKRDKTKKDFFMNIPLSSAISSEQNKYS